MTVALILDFPGGTIEQYHEVAERMPLEGGLPPGVRSHVAGIYEGGLRIIDVWEDMATFERWRDAQIIPNTQAAGIAAPRVRVLEVDEQKQGSGDAPAFVQVVTLPGLSREAFHEADAHILPTGEAPEAITFHVNGPVDGGWCVIDGWTSKQARDEFLEARVRPVMESAALSGPPRFEDLTVEASMVEGARAAA